MREQRNGYKGSPSRPWVRVTLVAADGSTRQCELLADTGNPCALIIDSATMLEFNLGLTTGMETNFGVLHGGWLRVQVPQLGFDEDVLAYASDVVVQAAKASHADFDGLAGLPLLQLMEEFGGNRESFWIRAADEHDETEDDDVNLT
jgi:hypothetical protein